MTRGINRDRPGQREVSGHSLLKARWESKQRRAQGRIQMTIDERVFQTSVVELLSYFCLDSEVTHSASCS